MLIRWIGNIALLIFIFTIWIFPVEGGLRWYFSKKGNPVEQVLPLLQPDKNLIWRQKSNQSARLWGVGVELDPYGFRQNSGIKNSPDPQAILLGPSSGFGWGVANENTYASQWGKISGKKILNASQIGFSSAQGAKLILEKEVDSLRPEMVLIAYGVNDLDRFRFFGQNGSTDNEFFAEKMPGLESVFWSRFALHTAIQKVVGGLSVQLDCRRLKYPARRVNEKERLENFVKIAEWAKSKNAQLILINTPFGGKERPMDSSAALANEKHYRLSEELAKNGDCQSAWKEFQAARKLETERIAWEIKSMNRELREWAKKRKLIFVDAAAVLRESSDFVDPIHPSIAGHKKLHKTFRI